MPSLQLTDRALVRLSGPDARPFLQNLLTQDVTLLAATQPLYAGLLSPQGKALFQLFLFADGADVLIDVATDAAERLCQRLLMFRLRNHVDITPEPALAVWQSWGEDSPQPPDPRHPLAGSRYVAAPAQPQPLDLWHAHRLTLGLPAADEIGSDELLWLETNARELNGVSFAKGCYVGQENTARMHHRQKLRKRLLPLRTATPLPLGAEIRSGGRAIGTVRGQWHAGLQMALLRTPDTGPDFAASLNVDGKPATLQGPPWLAPET